MKNPREFVRSGLMLLLCAWVAACVVTPTEGYYDRDHHRYYHEHSWHDCGEHDGFCH